MMRRATHILGAAALVLASCGGDAEEDQRAGATTPSASATVAASDSPTPSPTPGIRTDYDLPPWDEIAAMYDYDTSESLDYAILGEADQKWMREHDRDPGSATVYDITYQSSGYPVPAWLVVPEGQGPFPAVIYAHGSTLDRDFHLREAVALAQDGYVGLSITGPEAREPFVLFGTGIVDMDLEGFVQYVTDLRRGVDLLATLPEVDAGRLGFEGLSAGCWVGASMSGVEERIDAYALMSCGGYLTDLWATGATFHLTGDALRSYQDETAVLNPVNYVGHNQGAAFLIQAPKTDPPDDNVQALYDAAPEPKELWWYTPPATEGLSGHGLGCEIATGCDPTLPATAYRLDWLKENV